MFTMPLVRRPTVSDLAGVCLSTMTVLGGERLVHHDAGVGQREAHARLPNVGVHRRTATGSVTVW